MDYLTFHKLVGIFAWSESCLASHKQEVHPYLESKYWLSTESYTQGPPQVWLKGGQRKGLKRGNSPLGGKLHWSYQQQKWIHSQLHLTFSALGLGITLLNPCGIFDLTLNTSISCQADHSCTSTPLTTGTVHPFSDYLLGLPQPIGWANFCCACSAIKL